MPQFFSWCRLGSTSTSARGPPHPQLWCQHRLAFVDASAQGARRLHVRLNIVSPSAAQQLREPRPSLLQLLSPLRQLLPLHETFLSREPAKRGWGWTGQPFSS